MRLPSRSEIGRRRTGALLLALVLVLGIVPATAVALRGTVLDSSAAPRWAFNAKMPHRRSYAASAKIGTSIYVAAGMVGNTGRPLDLFERFDPRRNAWTSLPRLPKAFSAAAGAALDGRMYVVGGNSPETDGRQVFVYDVQRRRWSPRAPLPAPRTNLSVLAHRGKLYAIGGLDPVHATDTVFVYDPASNGWSEAAPLPEALHALATVSFRGEIWALGGRLRPGAISRRIWIYNPGTDSWRAGPPMPEPMETHGAVVVGDRIHVVLESIYVIYDARTGRWIHGPSLRVPRHALAAFNSRGRLYAIGGCIVPQLEDSPIVESIGTKS
jgi:hypothetical protein